MGRGCVAAPVCLARAERASRHDHLQPQPIKCLDSPWMSLYSGVSFPRKEGSEVPVFFLGEERCVGKMGRTFCPLWGFEKHPL